MSKLTIWHQGDHSEAICPTCKGWQGTTFTYRPFLLEKSKVEVPDVLVGVCSACDTTLTVPHQSVPKIKAARRKEPSRVDARIPKELRDVLGVLATEFGGDAESFAGGLVRYYMQEMTESRALARRVALLASSKEAAGTAGGRLAFRLDRCLLAKAMASVRGTAVSDKSALVRGIIVAAKHDVYDRPNKSRVNAFKAIAAAV